MHINNLESDVFINQMKSENKILDEKFVSEIQIYYLVLDFFLKGQLGQKFPVDMLNQTAWERHCFLPEQNRTKIGRDMGRLIQLAQK